MDETRTHFQLYQVATEATCPIRTGSSVVEQMPAKGMVVNSSLTRSVGFPTAWPLCRQRRKLDTYFQHSMGKLTYHSTNSIKSFFIQDRTFLDLVQVELQSKKPCFVFMKFNGELLNHWHVNNIYIHFKKCLRSTSLACRFLPLGASSKNHSPFFFC